ncbi:hypothetical protein ANCCEY_01248 [Ancylostoma ceylanicum]|uniref:Kelch repeat protein n=1 Tax=Ancylostoma ceylanicum TaxID=53326 RepID=A0A0D6M6C4_9BILA|nr:hypothetical protein ANCCEY_01248 [Ancylostoma ceylanicum]
MAFEKVGDSYKSAVAEPCDYNRALFVNDKIWLFGQKFVSQPTFNWGHHVAFAGTYGIAFNTANNKWEEPHTFSAVTNEENRSEAMFVFNGAVHMLLFTAFGGLAMSELHEWTGSSFKSVNLKSFAPIAASDKSARVTLVAAEGPDDKTIYLISTMEHQMRVARLTASGDGATIDHLFDITADQRTSLAQATSGVVSGGRLLVSYGMHGCGFRWEKGSIIACDIEKKTCETLEITSDPAPRWGFNGALGRGLMPSGAWVHAGGSVPKGMSGSSFDGSIWELINLDSTPAWKQLDGSIPSDMEGEVVVDTKHGNVYSIGKTQIGKAKI